MLYFQRRKGEALDFWQSLLNRRVVAGQIAERVAKIVAVMTTPQPSGQKIDLPTALAEYEAMEASSTWADVRADVYVVGRLHRDPPLALDKGEAVEMLSLIAPREVLENHAVLEKLDSMNIPTEDVNTWWGCGKVQNLESLQKDVNVTMRAEEEAVAPIAVSEPPKSELLDADQPLSSVGLSHAAEGAAPENNGLPDWGEPVEEKALKIAASQHEGNLQPKEPVDSDAEEKVDTAAAQEPAVQSISAEDSQKIANMSAHNPLGPFGQDPDLYKIAERSVAEAASRGSSLSFGAFWGSQVGAGNPDPGSAGLSRAARDACGVVEMPAPATPVASRTIGTVVVESSPDSSSGTTDAAPSPLGIPSRSKREKYAVMGGM